ncbi:hypothetical protein [Bacillus sp. UNC438CL73TsuS30]|uniref:hypothetical protein n=1 Tax=Bacillus sp. UNC438CL73TsuS30 TaxID=1340434 RepID=UPI000552EE25|nr:hypothetical protein [Bacillus sp. UNC438CL73TsuS30]
MADYVVNKAGAKIFSDITKHKTLPIPTLLTQQAEGAVYEVLSVGMHGGTRTPIATVKEGGKSVAYVLPEGLNGWVENTMLMSMQGIKLLPSKIEFGILDGRTYAEIL